MIIETMDIEVIEAEQHRIAEENRKKEQRIREAREDAEREEQVLQAIIRAEQEAKEQADREETEAEERLIAELEQQEALRKRLEALKPDAERIHDFAGRISDLVLSGPEVRTDEAVELMRTSVADILRAVAIMREFGR